MKLFTRLAAAIVLVLAVPMTAQALSITQSGVRLAASRSSIDLGGRVVLHGFVSFGSRHCRPHHPCPPPPPPPPPPCHPHHSVTIYRNGTAVATVPTDASGRFSYSYTAADTSTWSAMFRGDRCHPHPHREIVYASQSRALTVSVTLGGEALAPRPRPRF